MIYLSLCNVSKTLFFNCFLIWKKKSSITKLVSVLYNIYFKNKFIFIINYKHTKHTFQYTTKVTLRKCTQCFQTQESQSAMTHLSGLTDCSLKTFSKVRDWYKRGLNQRVCVLYAAAGDIIKEARAVKVSGLKWLLFFRSDLC